MQKQKRVIVSVTNDLVTDNRVRRLCSMLAEMGYDVWFVGRHLPHSPSLPKEKYRMVRMRLLFRRSVLFYAEYNIRLFLFLLFRKADVLVANDLDTLLPNYIISKLKGLELVYDSHELFTEVPELKDGSFAKRTWETLERAIIPNLRHCITVNLSIAGIFQKKYGVSFMVLRNMPYRYRPSFQKKREELGLPVHKKIIVLQGNGINVERGAEEAVLAIKYMKIPVLLLFIGNGDVLPTLKQIVKREQLDDKVKFLDRMSYADMMQYTAAADLGITFDKPKSLNYYYSLPNKIFDYIQAEIPVLASRLPELEHVINDYDIGDFIEEHSPVHIAEKMEACLTDNIRRENWRENLRKASVELCRENEETEMKALYEKFLKK